MGAQGLSHWTTREVSGGTLIISIFFTNEATEAGSQDSAPKIYTQALWLQVHLQTFSDPALSVQELTYTVYTPIHRHPLHISWGGILPSSG